MKLAKMAMAVATLAVSSGVMAGSISTSSDEVEILAFNGNKTKEATLQVAAGKPQQAVVSVGGIVSGSYFNIDPIVLTFDGTDEDVQIVVPKLNTELAVEKFKQALNFKIQTASGKELAYKKDFLKGEGFAPNGRIEENLAKYNTSKAVASVPAFANAVFEKKGQVVVETDNVKEEQLQLLFKKADKETQKRFLEWAKKQK